MPDLLAELRARAAERAATLLLAEGEDPRVAAAAEEASAAGLCRPVLVGAPEAVARAAAAAGVPLTVPVLDPAADPELPRLADRLGRRMPGLGREAIEALARDPLHYAALRVAAGLADGAVMGAVADHRRHPARRPARGRAAPGPGGASPPAS